MALVRRLSSYVLWQWLRIFVLATIGLPLVSVLINTTDRLNRLLDRDLTGATIALAGLYGLPGHMAQMVPAAALFATVFTIGPLARNSEITAAKAGGISFHRLVLPLIIASAFAAVFCYWIGEVATETTGRQLELEKERVARNQTSRFEFVYLADNGWTYSVRSLNTETKTMQGVVLEHAGRSKDYANVAISADSARWNDTTSRWRLLGGSQHIIKDSTDLTTLRFASLEVKAFDEPPRSLLIEPKRPEEMGYQELGAYIETLDRSGSSDVKKLQVDQAIKIALPVACIVIALFGAPLAMTNPRAGAAWGIAISLGTTVLYLLMINLSKAVGSTGVISPVLSAWIPNMVFLVLGLWLMVRVRT
jgi:lipopolysaccharide export system permease protein